MLLLLLLLILMQMLPSSSETRAAPVLWRADVCLILTTPSWLSNTEIVYVYMLQNEPKYCSR